jgi:hypothetical protein
MAANNAELLAERFMKANLMNLLVMGVALLMNACSPSPTTSPLA